MNSLSFGSHGGSESYFQIRNWGEQHSEGENWDKFARGTIDFNCFYPSTVKL